MTRLLDDKSSLSLCSVKQRHIKSTSYDNATLVIFAVFFFFFCLFLIFLHQFSFCIPLSGFFRRKYELALLDKL